MTTKRKKTSKILVTAIFFVTGIVAFIVYSLHQDQPEEVIQGYAEVTDYRVSSKIAGRVRELRVQEGMAVSRGDTLAVLDAPDIEAKLAQATAAYQMAESQELKARNGSRQEQIQGAYEQWQKAIAGRDVAEKTYQRVQRLADQGVMPEQKRDEARAQYDAAVATEKAARSQYDMAVNGARQEDKQAATAQASRARGAISEVNSYLREGILTASADGIVTEIFPEPGELVGSGAPIMNIATSDIWFVFNVREDLLQDVRMGQQKQVYLPALDCTVEVEVTRIKDVGSFAVWKSTKALDRYDLKTFEVKARPRRAVSDVHAGMSAVLQ